MRRFPRRAVRQAIHWRVRGTVTQTVSATTDVGPGGVFIETLSPRRAGTPIVLRMPALVGERELAGVVVRSDGRGMGIALETGSWLGARALRPD